MACCLIHRYRGLAVLVRSYSSSTPLNIKQLPQGSSGS